MSNRQLARVSKLKVLLLTTSAMAVLAAVGLTAPANAADFPAVIELSALTGSNGFQINGEAVDNYSGSSVASAGGISMATASPT